MRKVFHLDFPGWLTENPRLIPRIVPLLRGGWQAWGLVTKVS